MYPKPIQAQEVYTEQTESTEASLVLYKPIVETPTPERKPVVRRAVVRTAPVVPAVRAASNYASSLAGTTRGTGRYQCVVYARMITGNPAIKGLARTIPVNSQTPKVGGVVKTRESSLGHVAVVTAIDGEWLTLSEANYDLRGSVLHGRKIRWSPENPNPIVAGFIN